jgi:hypothetical protein
VIARCIAMIVLTLSLPSIASAQDFPALASGGAPPCPEHIGIREHHSAVGRDGDISVSIVGVAKRDRSGCRQSAEIQVDRNGETTNFVLPEAERQKFAIVDFSPDGSTLFVAAAANQKYPNEMFRYLQVTAMPVSSGEMRWQNVWDMLGWKDCDATVEPQGFTVDGKLAMRARPSVMAQPRRANCVSEARLFPMGANIKRYGKTESAVSGTCHSDPDLVGACFTVHGRLSAFNGNPTFRIWRIGTKRYLGVSQEVLPEPLTGKVNFDGYAVGDFLVCPFTVEKPGWMQMVCIESASNLRFKPLE